MPRTTANGCGQQQAGFRLLRIRSFDRDEVLLVEDLATEKTLSILDRDIPVAAVTLYFMSFCFNLGANRTRLAGSSRREP
jgi:hypothetical protein